MKKVLQGHSLNKIPCSLACSTKSNIILSGDYLGILHIWRWNIHSKPFLSSRVHRKACISTITISNTNVIITSSWDGFVKMWTYT